MAKAKATTSFKVRKFHDATNVCRLETVNGKRPFMKNVGYHQQSDSFLFTNGAMALAVPAGIAGDKPSDCVVDRDQFAKAADSGKATMTVDGGQLKIGRAKSKQEEYPPVTDHMPDKDPDVAVVLDPKVLVELCQYAMQNGSDSIVFSIKHNPGDNYLERKVLHPIHLGFDVTDGEVKVPVNGLLMPIACKEDAIQQRVEAGKQLHAGGGVPGKGASSDKKTPPNGKGKTKPASKVPPKSAKKKSPPAATKGGDGSSLDTILEAAKRSLENDKFAAARRGVNRLRQVLTQMNGSADPSWSKTIDALDAEITARKSAKR